MLGDNKVAVRHGTALPWHCQLSCTLALTIGVSRALTLPIAMSCVATWHAICTMYCYMVCCIVWGSLIVAQLFVGHLEQPQGL